MGFAFNPFTGNFDQKGSGGGGSSYIDGEVATYNDLPLDGTAALNSAWLVRSASGVWPVSRKQAGIYIRTATGGSSRDADYTYAGTMPDVFSDANFVLYDNGDSTKNLQFQLSGISTGTVRTLTVPDVSGTIALTSNFAAPPAIGSTTPAAGSFTTLNATGTTELVNGGTTAGPFRLYNTFTSATSFERLNLRWASNVAIIGTEKGSVGGTARALEFQTDGVTRMTVGATGSTLFSGDINCSTTIRGNIIGWISNGNLGWTFTGGAAASINTGSATLAVNLNVPIVRIGGTTNAFPALKRDSTTLQVRLADDSAFAPLSCGALTLNGNLDASTRDLVTDTTTGTKIGTGTTQKIGFFNATPVVQQAAIADATDAATTQARLNDLLAAMRTLGLIAT